MSTLNITDDERREGLEETRNYNFPVIIQNKPYFPSLDSVAIFAGYTGIWPSKYFKDNPERLKKFSGTAVGLTILLDDIAVEACEKLKEGEIRKAEIRAAQYTLALEQKKNDPRVIKWYEAFPKEKYPDRYL